MGANIASINVIGLCMYGDGRARGGVEAWELCALWHYSSYLQLYIIIYDLYGTPVPAHDRPWFPRCRRPPGGVNTRRLNLALSDPPLVALSSALVRTRVHRPYAILYARLRDAFSLCLQAL